MAEIFATRRLDLVVMDRPFLEAGLAGDLGTAGRLLGASVPSDWLEMRWFMNLRLGQVREDPRYESWGPRAVVLRDEARMVGHAGFHSPPDPPYLAPYGRGAVEVGYTVFEPDRGRGYATEAVDGLIRWARRRGVERVVLSIGPTNAPSIAVARRLGFSGPVATVIDDEDGPEDIYVLETPGPG